MSALLGAGRRLRVDGLEVVVHGDGVGVRRPGVPAPPRSSWPWWSCRSRRGRRAERWGSFRRSGDLFRRPCLLCCWKVGVALLARKPLGSDRMASLISLKLNRPYKRSFLSQRAVKCHQCRACPGRSAPGRCMYSWGYFGLDEPLDACRWRDRPAWSTPPRAQRQRWSAAPP